MDVHVNQHLHQTWSSTCMDALTLTQVALDTATHAVLAARQPVATSRRMSIGPQVPAQ